MLRKLHPMALAVLLLAWPLSSSALAQGKKCVQLFSETDAKSLRLSEAEWKQPRMKTRSLSMGPQIKIETPTPVKGEDGATIATTPTLNLYVTFQEKNAPVDMNSLTVKGKKGPFSKDLTDKVKPFVQGNMLKAENLTIPEGKFMMEFSVADAKGVKTTEEYRVEVAK
jgi:hypothetical protein